MSGAGAPVIYVFNLKGGVAKTTTAVNLAAEFGEMGKRTLMVDLDPQAAATWMLAPSPPDIQHSVYAALKGGKPLVDIIQRTRFQNVDVVPASVDLYGLDLDIDTDQDRELLLSKALAPARNIYDLILIDSHNKYGLTEINALCASDLLLVPVSCSPLPFYGLDQLNYILQLASQKYGHSTRVIGYVLTLYHRKIVALHSECKEVERKLRDKYGPLVFGTVIEYDENIERATSLQEPISYFQQHTRGAREFNQLAVEVLDRLHDGYGTKRIEGGTNARS